MSRTLWSDADLLRLATKVWTDYCDISDAGNGVDQDDAANLASAVLVVGPEHRALRKQAECAAGLAEALRGMVIVFDEVNDMQSRYDSLAFAERALAAYDAAKGGK